MQNLTRTITGSNTEPFSNPRCDALLLDAKDDLETGGEPTHGSLEGQQRPAAVLLRWPSLPAHPARARSMDVLSGVLYHRLVCDPPARQRQFDLFLERLLAKSMVRLMTNANRISEPELRQICSRGGATGTTGSKDQPGAHRQPSFAVQVAENEGMPPHAADHGRGAC